MHCRCIAVALQGHHRCIACALQVHHRCIAGASQVHCKCIDPIESYRNLLVRVCSMYSLPRHLGLKKQFFQSCLYSISDILAILSVQHQTIHIYQLDTDLGGFCPIVNIGRTLFDDDELLLSRTGNLNFRSIISTESD